MAETWQNSYEELKKFIADHPAIEITPTCVVIMGDIRPDFYKLFDAVRAGFLKERFPQELQKSYAMGAAYAAASKAAREEMHLEDIEINASLNWFLLDPVNGLMRVLFDTLFDLLKGKTDMEGFIKASDAAVRESFNMLFREGYERWGALELLILLQPGRFWAGKTHDFYTDASMEGDVIEGNRDDYVPDLVETKKLVFDNLVRASFVVPAAVIYSGNLHSFVSLRPRWYLPRWKARLRSERPDWIELKQIYRDYGTGNLWPDMLIHVTDERPDDLKLIADYYRLARPEIIVEFMEDDNWWDARHVEDLMRHNLVIGPRLGSYVISRVEVPPEAFKPLEAVPMQVSPPPPVESEPQGFAAMPPVGAAGETPVATTEVAPPTPPPPPPMARPLSLAELPENIHVLSVGYDMRKMEPLVQALMEAAASIKEARAKELASGGNNS